MKKYPFSKKAVTAMIAATVAFSPVVSVGGMFEASKVEAAGVDINTEIDTLANRFFIFYNNASFTTPDSINGLTFDSINQQAAARGISLEAINTNEGKAAFANLMKNTATLIYTDYSTAADLSAAIKSFRSDNATYLNTLFEENGDIVAEDLILFVNDLEGQLESAIGQVALSQSPSYSAVISTAVNNTFSIGPNLAEYQDLDGKLSKIGLSVQQLFILQEQINNSLIDQDKSIRSAMMQSAFIGKNAIITNDNNNKYGLTVPVNGLSVTLGASLQWDTSDHSVATFSGNTLTKVANGTTNIIVKLDGITLASTSLTVSGMGGGGGVITPGEEPVVPVIDPEDGDVTVPEDVVEVVKEETESGVVEIVTSVPVEKVADIVDLITEESTVVPLTLATTAEGEVAKAEVPATLFTEAVAKNEEAVVKVQTEDASYKLPASEIDVADLAAKLGVEASDVQIEVAVNVIPVEDVQAEVDNNNLNPISKIVEFTVTAVSGDKSEHISTFSVYVERDIVMEEETAYDPDRSIAVRFNEDGTFNSIPTFFNEEANTATIKSLTNSKYTIVTNDKTFTDVDNGKNWAEAHIEKLASKYIINGKTATAYAPSQDITRGEFAALISRGLGLVAEDPTEVKFQDVPATKAVNKNGEINAAVEAGIIKGFGDGTFRPDQPLTRAEAAIMIARAMEFTNVPADKINTEILLTKFKDNAKIGVSSRDSIELVAQADIMSGFGNGEFGPYQNTKRDQMAKVLDKFLQVSDLMN